MRVPAHLALCLLLAACAQPPQKETARICDSAGCVERPRDYVSPEVAQASQPEDDGRAAALQSLAERDPRAAYDLALRYFRGDGVRQDSYQALTWMRSAAERGHLQAQKALGRFYLSGLEEMGPDPAEAEKWLTIAAGRGDKESAKLKAEASAARKSDDAERRFRQHWRPLVYDYWYRGYPYLGLWRDGNWYYR
ncbi:tetratricopeptide repeat protein [Thauera sinica]|uniref:Tetratricopeptide repeat protein n=1 Tax=Thauera sinica TaxID=2665146 RepID=A0ABW1ARS6_9RHOO|nr:SEL1-like repeat protein [Thauera sp. K11]ATE61059.1 hypothetical protein CCZ27_14910 [Thauera sp. K11]